MSDLTESANHVLLCSNCFTYQRLRIDAAKHGLEQQGKCPNCQASDGKKLTRDHIEDLAWRFFVSGTTVRRDYGAAPAIQFKWFRAKVHEALADNRPGVSHQQVMDDVQALIDRKRRARD